MASRPIRFPIPDTEIPGLKALAHTAEEVLQKIADALAAGKPTLEPGALAETIAGRGDLDPSVVRRVVPSLWKLALVRRRFDASVDAFLQMLGAGLKEAGPDRWNDSDAEAWSARLALVERILAPEGPLALGAKAAELLLEQHLVFCNARILTDVRPVFDERAETIQWFLPFHTLAVTCHEGGDTKTIHIAMDFNDLSELGDQVKRAQQKERLLRSDLDKAGLMVIQTGSEPDA